MREKTGPVPIPEPDRPFDPRGLVSEYPRYRYVHEKSTSNGGLSKDTWVKLITWLTPIIFAAGALYYSIGSMADRVKNVEGAMSMAKETQGEVRSEQRILDVQIKAIREKQVQTEAKIDKVGDKMDAQKDDLSAIKAKLGIRRRNR